MKIHWQHQNTGIGCAFGYTTFARKLVGALVKKGVEYSDDSPVSIHMIPPYFFRLDRFKQNVLFSMFEFDSLPKQWGTYMDRADLVIVPCTQNKRIFEAATETKVEICPGGVDAMLYPYQQRQMADPFTFLFVGDSNPRKGTRQVAEAWDIWNERYPSIAAKTQLIMKMTSPGKVQEQVQITSNSYIDYRVLPLTEKDSKRTDLPTLPSLYEYANAFLFPTMGEGWGLPLCEAMSTGLPCIYTPFGGTEDTASEVYAYPIEYDMERIFLHNPLGGKTDPVDAASPRVESIVDSTL
jgi:glycosyltransferase involved in cell wall biosynthesis